jgi:hypothetical protein
MHAMLRLNFGFAARGFYSWHLHEGCSHERQPRSTRTNHDLLAGHTSFASAPPDSSYHCCSKHGQLSELCTYSPPVVLTVMVLRSPFSWVSKMCRHAHSRKQDHLRRIAASRNLTGFKPLKLNFTVCLRTPANELNRADLSSAKGLVRQDSCSRSDGIAIWSEVNHCKLVQLWSAMAGAARLWAAPKVLLRYDEVLSPDVLAAKLLPPISAQGILPFADPSATFQMPLNPDSGAKKNRKNYLEFSQGAYKSAAKQESARSYMKYFTKEDVEWVNAQLRDVDLKAFGFERETTL